MEKHKTKWSYYLIALIIIIILVIGIAPWIDGMIFRQQVYRLADIVNAKHKFQVDIIQYDRGWLHSQVIIKVTPVAKNGVLENIATATRPALSSFTVTSQVTHGPMIVDQAPFFGIAGVQSVIAVNSSAHTVRMKTFVGFTGQWTNRVRASLLTIVKPHYGTIQFTGLVGTVSFKTADNRIKKFNSDLHSDMMTVKPDHAISSVTIKALSVNYDTKGYAVTNAPWNTSMHFSAPVVSITVNPAQGGQEKIYRVKNIKFSTDFGAESASNHYQMMMNFSAERMMANDDSVTPMSSIHYAFSVTGLNGHAILTLVNQLKFAQAQGLHSTLKAYTTFLPAILTPKSRLTQKFNLNTAKGSVSGDGVLYFPSSMKEAPRDIFTILYKTNVSANVLMSIPLFDAWFSSLTTPNTFPKATWHTMLLKQLIQGWIDEGYIAKSVSNYAISIERHHGKLKINGKSFSVLPKPTIEVNTNVLPTEPSAEKSPAAAQQ